MPASAIADQNGRPLSAWLSRRRGWQRFGLALVLGALMTGAHPPVSVPWVLFAAVPVLVLLALTARSAWGAAAVGWAAAFGYFITGLHWMGHAFLVDPDRFAWLLPLGVTALPFGFGFFWALAFGLARRLAPGGIIAGALTLVAFWTFVEYLRSTILTGFPWALPGYAWVDLPPMQAAAWIGPHGVTLITLAVTALPGIALVERRLFPAALALAIGAGLWIGGALRVPDTIAYADDAPVLRVIQPNAPQHLKWQPGHYEQFYRRLIDATARAPDPVLGPPDVIVWPETSIQLLPAEMAAVIAQISDAAGDAWVLLGTMNGEGRRPNLTWTNALTTIAPDGRLGPRYDKHHLVPFGEYLPMEPVFDALGLAGFAIRGGFARGPGPQTLHLDGVPPFSPLICYEAIFPNEVVGPDRPDWLLQPTNDAWFGSWAGPRQHYAQARIRAIEQGLPMVRAANTGISAIVDPYGREVVSIPLHNFNYMDAKLPAALDPTLYGRTGDLLALILMVGLVFGVRVRRVLS